MIFRHLDALGGPIFIILYRKDFQDFHDFQDVLAAKVSTLFDPLLAGLHFYFLSGACFSFFCELWCPGGTSILAVFWERL